LTDVTNLCKMSAIPTRSRLPTPGSRLAVPTPVASSKRPRGSVDLETSEVNKRKKLEKGDSSSSLPETGSRNAGALGMSKTRSMLSINKDAATRDGIHQLS
jgi:hypothetical protein